MRPELNGKWTVKLIYGPSFGQLEHEALFFTMDLVQKEDEFKGSSRDVDGIGLSPYQSTVSGFTDGEQINFVKEYQVPVLFGANGNAEQNTDQKGQEASFWGVYNAATGEYEGEWIIVSGYTLLGDVFFERENGGSWSMKREAL